MRFLKQKWKKFATQVLEVPHDLVWRLPRVTIVGCEQCFVENIQGINYFSDSLLILDIDGGQIEIRGQQFIITSLNQAEVCVQGILQQVAYHTRKR